MYQKFYTNTLQSNFIKYILQNTYIPTIPFTCNINHITKNGTYIHDNYFVKAKKSDDMSDVLKKIEDNPNAYSEYFLRYDPYIFGKRYIGLTTNFTSNTNTYDSETHYYLGQYIKAYKAYYGIDLFPYYNCYSNDYLSNIDIRLDNLSNIAPFIKYYSNQYDNKYKIISVPISFCQEYTIALDCASEVLMCPIFIGKKGLLVEPTQILHKSLAAAPHLQLHLKSNYIQPIASFNKPFYYFSPCIPGTYDEAQLNLVQYEKYLRLLIKIPAQNNSSITILQGHYSNVKSYQDKIINLSVEDVLTTLTRSYDKDYIQGREYSFNDDVMHELVHYGFLSDIFKAKPALIESTDNNLRLVETSSRENETLDLKFTVNYEEAETSKIAYPQETPCIKYLDLSENIFTGDEITLANLISIIDNSSDYIDNTQFNLRVTQGINSYTYLISNTISANVQLSEGDIIEIKALGNQSRYDSAWSPPMLLGSTRPVITTRLDGTIFVNKVDEYSYKYTINSSSEELAYYNNVIHLNPDESITIYQYSAGNLEAKTIATYKPKILKYNLKSIISDSTNLQFKVSSLRNASLKIVIDNLEYMISSTWSDPINISYASIIDLYFNYSIDATQIEIITDTIKITIQRDQTPDITLKDRLNITVQPYTVEITGYNSNFTSEIILQGMDTNLPKLKLSSSSEQTLKFENANWIEHIIENDPDINNYLNKYLYNNLSLLYLNDTISYAFTNRLFEYLLNNVITKDSTFGKNIQDIQATLKVENSRYYQQIRSDAVWTPELRIQAFEIANKYCEELVNQPNFKDINGFIDKDTEAAIIRWRADFDEKNKEKYK